MVGSISISGVSKHFVNPTGERITDTAQALDFASDSAFIYFFRTMTGMTPGRYFSA